MNPVRHVAIIMDGNGRWAERHGMPRWKGHEAGAQAVRRTVEAACRAEVEILTLFAFSSENWKRPSREIDILFRLLLRYLKDEAQSLVDNGVRLSAFGRRDRFSTDVREALTDAEDRTRHCRRLHLRLGLDYGSRREIVEAARLLARRVAAGELTADQIDEDCFSDSLGGDTVPDPELIIRTSGEQRLSNFLLWQAAYSELRFTAKYWPDFEESDLLEALADYHSRTRKFGALPYATALIE
jgi:undecaprenyl diphosphate synthase